MQIIVASQRTPAALLIRFFTFSKWNHSAICFEEEVFDSTFIPGVQLRSKKDFLKKYTRYEIINVTDVPYPDQAYEFAKAQVGKKYDWKALFGIFFQKRRWQEEDRWFCSELVEATIAAAGRQRFRDKIYRITPHQNWSVI